MLVLSDELPTADPNGELINPNLTILVQLSAPMYEVIVHEPATGLFQSKTTPMEVVASDPNEETNIDVTWPSDIIL